MDDLRLFLCESYSLVFNWILLGLIIYLLFQHFKLQRTMQDLLALKQEVAANIVGVDKVNKLIQTYNALALEQLSKVEASDEAQIAQLNQITAILNGTVPQSDAPAETPAETPVETPGEKPAETPADAPPADAPPAES